jgi:hypothetical protein
MLEREAEQFERDEDEVDPWDFCGPSSDFGEKSIIHRHFYIAKDLLALLCQSTC